MANEMVPAKSFFGQNFGIDSKDLDKVLATALAKKADYADLYFEYRKNEGISLEEGLVKNCSQSYSNGVGVSGSNAIQPADSRPSYDRFADQDSELHDRIAEGSGNALIQQSLARLHAHLHIFRLRFHSEVTTEAFAEHARLVEALAARDGAAAEAAMRAHIERSYQRMVPFARD